MSDKYYTENVNLYSFNSAEKVIDFIERKIKIPLRLTGQYYHFTHPIKNGGWIFRGQPDATKHLIPVAFRENKYQELYAFEVDKNTNPEIKRRAIFYKETIACSNFLKNADEAGLDVPLNRIPHNYFDSLLNISPDNPKSDDCSFMSNDAYIEALALAQHHGVPTRLLDWTSNPYIACYFAAYKVSSACPQQETSEKIAMFALNTQILFEDTIKIAQPRFCNNLYLKHQKGLFTHTAMSVALRNARLL